MFPLFVRMPGAVEVARPIPYPASVAKMRVDLEEGGQLLGADLFYVVNGDGSVQRLTQILVDQTTLESRGQQRNLGRDLNLLATVRGPHPRELHAQTEDALAAWVRLAMALLGDDDLEGPVGRARRHPGASTRRRHELTASDGGASSILRGSSFPGGGNGMFGNHGRRTTYE
jgi:hypothetical protein